MKMLVIVREEKTTEITTNMAVKISDLNYYKMLLTLSWMFSRVTVHLRSYFQPIFRLG